MEDKVKVTTDSKSSASVIEPGWTDVLHTGKVHEKGRGGADDSDEDVARTHDGWCHRCCVSKEGMVAFEKLQDR